MNITITLTSLSSQRTDSIEITPATTTLSELCQYAVALLELPSSENISLTKNGNRLFTSSNDASSSSSSNNNRGHVTLASAGIQHGDLIVVIQGTKKNKAAASSSSSNASSAAVQPSNNVPSAATSSSSSSSGGLDFSSLLASATTNSTPAPAASATTISNNSSGGLQFNLPMLSLMDQQTGQQSTNSAPVQWDGMTLDDAMSRNPNPDCFVKVLLDDQRHENLLKELNYHNPLIAKKLKAAGLKVSASIHFSFYLFF